MRVYIRTCALLLLALTACTAPVGRPVAPVVPVDEHSNLFLQGLDEMIESGRSESLDRLAEDGTAGRWQLRAKNLLGWKQQAGNLSRDIENLRQQLRQARTTEEQMTRDNAMLKKDLAQLKRILVEMETRPK